MEETGYKLVSNTKALKNQSFTFGYPKAYAAPEDPHNDYYKRAKEYLPRTITIYGSGYIRMTEIDPDPNFQPGVLAKFSNGTLEGWAEGFKKMQTLVTKWKEEWYKKKFGITLYTTPEERHLNRGKIGGSRFNF